VSSRYTPQQLQTKILTALLQYENEAEMCHGRRVDDGRWYWECQCLPKNAQAPSNDLSHQKYGQGDDGSTSAGRSSLQGGDIHFDVEIVQLAVKKQGSNRRRDSQQTDRQVYILHFYNKSLTQMNQSQRVGSTPVTSHSQMQLDQQLQERFRMVTSRVLKLIDL